MRRFALGALTTLAIIAIVGGAWGSRWKLSGNALRPSGTNVQVAAPLGLTDIGPVPMVALTADNHGQEDTYTDFKVLVDKYRIPFTIFVQRGSGFPPNKASDPSTTTDLTNTELTAASNDPLWEVGTHSASSHSGASWVTYGYVSNANSTVTKGYDLANVFAGALPAVDDMMWFYGGGGAQYITALTDDNHLSVNAAPGQTHTRQFFHIADDTVTGTIDCVGTATATVTSADPPVDRLAAPTFSGTGWGAMIWIEGSTTGNPYYVLDYDTATNAMTLNRSCTDGGAATTFHLAHSVDGLGNSLTESLAAIRTDVGDSTLPITSWAAPKGELPRQKALLHAARGIMLNLSQCDVLDGGVPLPSLNRMALCSVGVNSNDTPEELRNRIRAAIDAEAIYAINLESDADPALYDPTSLGSRDGVTPTEFDCDDANCAFVTNGVQVNDFLIIDDPLVTEFFTITGVAAETLTVSESLPAVSGADFWIVDDAEEADRLPFETAETLFKFLNDNRDQVVAMTATKLAERGGMFAGSGSMFNLVQNPRYRVTLGSDLGSDAAGAKPFNPWIFDSGNGSKVTRVERFGVPMLKIDTSAAGATVNIAQPIVVQPDRNYIVWAESEVESATSISTLTVTIDGLAGSMFDGLTVDQTLKSSGPQNKVTFDTGNDAINTYTHYFAFSTVTPQYYYGHVADPVGAPTLTDTVGFQKQAQILVDGTLDDGITTINFPGQIEEGRVAVQPTTADRYCAVTTRATTSFVVTCYDNAGVASDSDYDFTIFPEPGQSPMHAVRNRRTAKLSLLWTGQGVIYWRPVVVVEDTNWINR